MIRNLVLAITSAAILASATLPANAAPCRDAKGKFTKCETVKKPPAKCRDAKGTFMKCPAPATSPT